MAIRPIHKRKGKWNADELALETELRLRKEEQQRGLVHSLYSLHFSFQTIPTVELL